MFKRATIGSAAIVGAAALQPPHGVLAQPTEQGDYELLCIENNVRVRAKPSLSAEVLGTVDTGDRVWLTGVSVEADGYRWIPISAQGTGLAGWATTDYFRLPDGSELGWLPGTVVHVNTDRVNLHRGPGINYKIVGNFNTGTEAIINDGPTEGDGSIWYNITIDNVTGWMVEDYLTEGSYIVSTSESKVTPTSIGESSTTVGTAQVNAADYPSLQAAYDALPPGGGTILLPSGRYDVRAGLALNRLKPAIFRGIGRWTRGNLTEIAPFPGNDPVIFSSGSPYALINFAAPATYNNAYGFQFHSLTFELNNPTTVCAIDAMNVCQAVVEDCYFWATRNAPANAVGINGYVDETYGDDLSWWRINRNGASKMALVRMGSGFNANQNVISQNFGFGHGKGVTDALPMIHLDTNTRSIVRDNNVEQYRIGIRLEDCVLCAESGNGGEAVSRFVDLINGGRNYLAPLGVTSAEANDRLVYVTNSTDNVIVAPNSPVYSMAVEYDRATSWYAECNSVLRGREASFGGTTAFLTNIAGTAITTQGGITVGGTIKTAGSAHNANGSSAALVLGSYHIWVDSIGRLRIKNGVPSSDTDGTVVGTQT
ncbi:MAG TPA: SH3 domain-containing protein [Mycobacterium sp.]|nr:SH3 domain-containing protein [Mycobacterium sp.]